MVIPLTITCWLAAATMASAAIRTGSVTYYCTASSCAYSAADLAPPSGPTFHPKPPPAITPYTLRFTYDPTAGVLTYSQIGPDGGVNAFNASQAAYCSETDPDPANDCDQIAATWTGHGQITIYGEVNVKFGSASNVLGPGENTFYSPTGQLMFNPSPADEALQETGIRGKLAPTVALSPDGQTLSWTWSSPYLRNEDFRQIQTDTEIATGPAGLEFNLYFNGFGPKARPKPKPKPVKVPTNSAAGAQVKPFVIVDSGDGSGILGGPNGRSIKRHGFKTTGFGRLHWTSYTRTDAYAKGIEWVDRCNPDCAGGTYYPDKATVHVYRPSKGVFTRMTVRGVHNGKAYKVTLRAKKQGGVWLWL